MVASFFFYPYGTNRNVKIFIGSDDAETRKEFSELCGNKKIKQFSVNTNAENPASSNTGASNQPLITVGMLERINGDEKGDAIVSVRGYEPIWSRFTPSFQLSDTYFSAGEADLTRKEAVLFEKEDYVFDITGASNGKRQEAMLKYIEEEEKKPDEFLEEREKQIENLNHKWDAQREEIEVQIELLANILTGKDLKQLKRLNLESKASFLYMIMEQYNKRQAMEIQIAADKIAKVILPQMKKIQEEAEKIR